MTDLPARDTADQPVRIGTASAMTEATVLIIEKHEMIRVLHEQHAFSDRFIAHMLARNIRVEADLVDQLFNSSEKRLARTLLLLARYGSRRVTNACFRKSPRRRSRKWSGRRAAQLAEGRPWTTTSEQRARSARRSRARPSIRITRTAAPASAPPRCLDGGDVDLLHRHHRLERALRLGAAGRKGIRERPRRDLP